MTDAPPRRRMFPGLLEALVGLSIVVSLSGIVVPIVGAELRASPRQETEGDMLAIVHGLRAYSRTTRFLPTGDRGRTNVAWLYGPGALPRGNSFAEGGDGRPLADVLLTDRMGGPAWQGPYVDALVPDPWGNAYLVNVDGLVDGRESPLVLSAGPNGLVETGARDRRAGGDDIGMSLE